MRDHKCVGWVHVNQDSLLWIRIWWNELPIECNETIIAALYIWAKFVAQQFLITVWCMLIEICIIFRLVKCAEWWFTALDGELELFYFENGFLFEWNRSKWSRSDQLEKSMFIAWMLWNGERHSVLPREVWHCCYRWVECCFSYCSSFLLKILLIHHSFLHNNFRHLHNLCVRCNMWRYIKEILSTWNNVPCCFKLLISNKKMLLQPRNTYFLCWLHKTLSHELWWKG